MTKRELSILVAKHTDINDLFKEVQEKYPKVTLAKFLSLFYSGVKDCGYLNTPVSLYPPHRTHYNVQHTTKFLKALPKNEETPLGNFFARPAGRLYTPNAVQNQTEEDIQAQNYITELLNSFGLKVVSINKGSISHFTQKGALNDSIESWSATFIVDVNFVTIYFSSLKNIPNFYRKTLKNIIHPSEYVFMGSNICQEVIVDNIRTPINYINSPQPPEFWLSTSLIAKYPAALEIKRLKSRKSNPRKSAKLSKLLNGEFIKEEESDEKFIEKVNKFLDKKSL